MPLCVALSTLYAIAFSMNALVNEVWSSDGVGVGVGVGEEVGTLYSLDFSMIGKQRRSMFYFIFCVKAGR